SRIAGSAHWDGAFTRRLDFEWRDYWTPETSTDHFVGRLDELEKLRGNLGESGGVAVVQSIGGFGGVGKTALSVAFGNRYRDQFPGGRVFHDFRSYRWSRSDTAADALGSVLKAVGAAGIDEIARLDHRERAELWQAVASDRRLLMVWDNVDGVEQLDGLIVRGDGCATIVTSRDIVRVEGVKPMRLDVLDEADAVAMFTAIAGEHPPELVAELVRRDLYVPVLIRTHAEEVVNEEIALDEIIADLPDPAAARHDPQPDHQKDLFDRLEGSYRRLDEQTRLAFRVLGAHPGYSATAGSLAAAMGCELDEAARRMKRLVAAGLAERNLEGGGQRDHRLRAYKAHDLIRAYGAHLAQRESVPGEDGEPIGERLHTQLALMGYFVDQLTGETFMNKKDWFGIESDSIRDLALSGTSDAHARLARFIGYRALVYCRYDVAEAAFRHAKTLAERAGDTQRTAHMLWGLGEVGRMTGDLEEAAEQYGRALAASRAAADPGGIGNAERGLGEVAQLLGDADEAEARYRAAMEAYGEIEDRRRIAYVQRGLARVAELRGDHALAEERFAAALESSRAVGDAVGVAYARRGTAEVLLAAGDLDRSVEQWRAAEAAFEEVGSPVGVATSWQGLGKVAFARGELDEAEDLFEQAYRVYREHGDTVAVEEVVADLARLREAR
ncbi:tetratricopeptide repeat protein, partial [Glycomyces tenuis]